jgi:hypothetical protein
MCREDDRCTSVGEMPQVVEQSRCRCRVEPGRRLVEEQQRRPRQQLHGDARPLALATGEIADRDVLSTGQAESVDHIGHDVLDVETRRASREPQPGRVSQRLVQGQFEVDDVVLGDATDRLLVRTCGRAIDAVDLDDSCRRDANAEHGLEHRRLAGHVLFEPADPQADGGQLLGYPRRFEPSAVRIDGPNRWSVFVDGRHDRGVVGPGPRR